jgi:hypothetical protein
MPKVNRNQAKLPVKPSERPLTARQEKFVAAYLQCLNGTLAYREAGYVIKNEQVAASSASALLRNPKVAARIATAIAKRTERTRISQDQVIQILLVEATDRGEGSMHSARVKAAELLGRHCGMFGEVHLHKHDHHSHPQTPQNIGISSQQVIDALPLETRIAVLETVRRVRAELEAKERLNLPGPTVSASPGSVIITTSEPSPPSHAESRQESV